MKFGDAVKLLELTPPVTKEQIKKQYRIMTKKYSPDLTQTSTTEALFRLVIEAYQLLWNNFDLFFSGKAFQPPPSQKPHEPPPPPKAETSSYKDAASGNTYVTIKGVGKMEIEHFSNGKSIRSLALEPDLYRIGNSDYRSVQIYKTACENLLDYLERNRDQYEWFARIYGCHPIERQLLLGCGFSPLFPQDNPPNLTYLHRDLL